MRNGRSAKQGCRGHVTAWRTTRALSAAAAAASSWHVSDRADRLLAIDRIILVMHYVRLVLTSSCLRVAALFDGHSGAHAANWLNERLYGLFSDEIYDEIVGEGVADEACETDGEHLHA
jgi:hypothetical protein